TARQSGARRVRLDITGALCFCRLGSPGVFYEDCQYPHVVSQHLFLYDHNGDCSDSGGVANDRFPPGDKLGLDGTLSCGSYPGVKRYRRVVVGLCFPLWQSDYCEPDDERGCTPNHDRIIADYLCYHPPRCYYVRDGAGTCCNFLNGGVIDKVGCQNVLRILINWVYLKMPPKVLAL